MKRIPLICATAVLALAACQKNQSYSEAGNTTEPNATESAPSNAVAMNGAGPTAAAIDTQFVTDGIKGDTAEVAIADLAKQKGSTAAVRDLGNMLSTDHGAHKDKLIALAQKNNVPVPTEPAAEGKANLDKLTKLSGAAFDSTLKQMLIASHTKGIAKNEKQASGPDPQTAALARDTVPVLKKHLAAAQAL